MKKIFRKNKKNNLLKHSYRPCDFTQNWSDSEHTQSLQTRNNGRFRMTLFRSVQTAALTLALSFFIVAPAMAQAPVPTLDNLHNLEITMPDTDPAQVYPESAYTLTEIENADPANLPQNAITLYDKTEVIKYYDPITGAEVAEADRLEGVEYKEVTTIETTAKYYLVNLKDSVTNIGEGDTTKYFEWSQNADTGNLEFKEVSTPTDGKQTITVNYNNLSDLNERINNTEDKSSETITGTFVNQTTGSTSGSQYGGAIYNYGSNAKLGDINADFVGNYAYSTNSYARGGAIYNFGAEIGNITGNFIGNYVFSSRNSAEGGAIYNYEIIGDITGDFIGNYASSDNSFSTVNGGAIWTGSSSKINNISGDFIANYVISNFHGAGGAIYNERDASSRATKRIESIKGNFIENYVSSHLSSAGGAIANNSKIGKISGDFIGNYTSSSSSYTYGGAISNSSTIDGISSDFIGNYTSSSSYYTYGGAISNNGIIDGISGDFINNYSFSIGDSVQSYAFGGAISNRYGTIGNITGDFIGNYVKSKSSYALGGAIYNYSDNNTSTMNITNNSFINNHAVSDTGIAKGGAIFTNQDFTLNSDNGNVLIAGNYTEFNGVKENNAIYVANNVNYAGEIEDDNTTFTFNAINNGKIQVDDIIEGGSYYYYLGDNLTIKFWESAKHAYNLELTGDETGAIHLNNEIKNANISIDNTNVYVNEGTNLAESRSLAVNSGILNIQHLNNQTINYESFSNNGTINLASVDVDLANESMGRITADTYGESNGTINVQGLNLLSDATKDTTSILFADKEISNSVKYTGVSPIAYSPIHKYEVTYNPDDGFFTFSRGGGASSGSYDAYNPAIMASSVATQAGAYTTQLQTFNYAFQHADTFMNIPYLERVAIINQGKYALSPTGDATDVGTYSPLLLKEESAGFWVKPYASFENVPLKNGPKVSNINYGTLVGYDSPLTSVGNGFERVLTGYIGYNGASQRYSGVDAYQNGGLLGGTATFYKGNFFNATTLSVGATAGDASTMYGSENYTMLLAGLGNKTGYNFEFFDGGMILQPSMLISYTFVNTFDYNNAAGVRIESDPMHAIQLAPGIKLIGNTKNGWQPYIGVSMVWNLLDESKVTADSVRLPEMSIKPYVQYGVGLQKRVNDKFLAFGQAMIHNGGRNGVSLSAGLRWKIGRE